MHESLCYFILINLGLKEADAFDVTMGSLQWRWNSWTSGNIHVTIIEQKV